MKDEILEYPYEGTITRTIAGKGMQPDTVITVYEGVMDEHMVTDDEGRVLQTSSYIISIPLTQSSTNTTAASTIPEARSNRVFH